MSGTGHIAGVLAPQLIVVITGALVLVADLVFPQREGEHPGRTWLAAMGVVGLIAAGAAVLMAPADTSLLGGTLAVDGLSRFFDLVFIGIGMAVIGISVDSVHRFTPWVAEYYALVLWCTAGNMMVALATGLFSLAVFLQLTSLPLIALLGLAKNDPRAREAALKYLLVVLVSTSLLLWGLSLVFGATGTDDMRGIAMAAAGGALPALGVAGLVFMLAGFAFKVTAVPFQFWAPDVYEGAPPAVTAFLSVGSKLAGFALVVRFLALSVDAVDVSLAVGALAVASMTLGNLGALKQHNIRRLLAYSGIAQAGYILVGIAASSVTGTSAVLFYLAAYAIANALAFTVVVSFVDATGLDEVGDLSGLARRNPLAAFALAAALMSLAGLPLTVGFMAKFYVFMSAAESGLYWLTLVAVINAVLAFAYYLRIVWTLYVSDEEHPHVSMTRRHALVMVVGTLGIVVIGLFPAPLLDAAHRAVTALIAG